MNTNIIKIQCPDERGIAHRVTGVLLYYDLNINNNQEFVEPDSNTFLMRAEVQGDVETDELLLSLKAVLPPTAQLTIASKTKKKIVLMATKEHHCLAELLVRHHYGELNANVVAVIANHSNLKELVDRFDIPFYHLSADGIDRSIHEKRILELIATWNLDYIVLAKYMRILTPEFISKLHNKIINIHHSFLPAFVGANPYRQAYDRGVKVIGATAHFVNNDLDQGPIIMQEVMNIDHSMSPSELAQAGRDGEKLVLAKALRLVLNENLFVIGNKTVIFQ